MLASQYLYFRWSNTCDLGNLLYSAGGFFNELYLNADCCEPVYKLEEKTDLDGFNRPIPTFQNLVKSYEIKLPFMPEYLADALSAIQLHDTKQVRLPFDPQFYDIEEVSLQSKQKIVALRTILRFPFE